MPVSITKVIGAVVSLFYALFIVTAYIYCEVCAWSLFSVVTDTGHSGKVTAQYNKNFELPASHRTVLLILCYAQFACMTHVNNCHKNNYHNNQDKLKAILYSYL